MKHQCRLLELDPERQHALIASLLWARQALTTYACHSLGHTICIEFDKSSRASAFYDPAPISASELRASTLANRRIDPAVRAHLARNPADVRRRAKHWAEDDCRTPGLCPDATQIETILRYRDMVSNAFQEASTLEVIADASRFFNTGYEIIACFSPDSNIGAYLPPQALLQINRHGINVCHTTISNW